jgi:hypothetical protein
MINYQTLCTRSESPKIQGVCMTDIRFTNQLQASGRKAQLMPAHAASHVYDS